MDITIIVKGTEVAEKANLFQNIINWCNTNNGFLTGVLSVLTLIVSIIALVISIRTALLPYKKKLLLSASMSWEMENDLITGSISSQIMGMIISVVNVGNRNVNLTFVGLAIRYNGKIMKLSNIYREIGGQGVLAPTEVVNVAYKVEELQGFLASNKSTKVYCCAIDTEGHVHLKRIGRAKEIYKDLQKM